MLPFGERVLFRRFRIARLLKGCRCRWLLQCGNVLTRSGFALLCGRRSCERALARRAWHAIHTPARCRLLTLPRMFPNKQSVLRRAEPTFPFSKQSKRRHGKQETREVSVADTTHPRFHMECFQSLLLFPTFASSSRTSIRCLLCFPLIEGSSLRRVATPTLARGGATDLSHTIMERRTGLEILTYM